MSPDPSIAISAPLAERLRPQAVEEVIGQDNITRSDSALAAMSRGEHTESLIFWGPPGCGKTSLARALVRDFPGGQWNEMQATSAGVKELREVFARELLLGERVRFLFIDEIHRFSRTQQDALLGAVESGGVVLMGATTENPSFALTAALMSRCRVVVLERLTATALRAILQRAEDVLGRVLPLTEEAKEHLFAMADGDGRYLLNMVESLAHRPMVADEQWDAAVIADYLARRAPQHDRAGEAHYNLISALHKSLRASDTDAALYWLARMLQGGDDPAYIARRLLRFAYEDVGLADPQACVQALTAWQTYERLGAPEGELALAQLVIYLGTAPKSNAVYAASKAARKLAGSTGSLMPPKRIRNAVTGLMKQLGYGRDYVYDHDAEHAFSGQNCFPDEMARQELYTPGGYGFEREIAKRLAWWNKMRGDKESD